MRVLLVGNGGREAALGWRIARSPTLSALAVTGANPGWPDGAVVLPASSPEQIVAAARVHRADLVVVGPEAPLAAGAAGVGPELLAPCPQLIHLRIVPSQLRQLRQRFGRFTKISVGLVAREDKTTHKPLGRISKPIFQPGCLVDLSGLVSRPRRNDVAD